jgi:hypothetical protein
MLSTLDRFRFLGKFADGGGTAQRHPDTRTAGHARCAARQRCIGWAGTAAFGMIALLVHSVSEDTRSNIGGSERADFFLETKFFLGKFRK